MFADAEKKVLPPNIQLYIARGIEPCNSTASGEARAVSLNYNKTRKNYGISWYGGRRPFILEEGGEKAGKFLSRSQSVFRIRNNWHLRGVEEGC